MKNLKELRAAKGYTQVEVAEMLGVTQQAYANYERGVREADYASLLQLAEIFNVSVDYLLGRTPSTADWIKENTEYPYTPQLKKIPVLGYVAAGKPILADEHIIDYTYTDIEDDSFEYFALQVKGDSMNAAQINDGNIVIVRIQSTCDNGDIVVVRVNNDDATVKRFSRIGDIVQLIPQSFNPEHQIQEYDLKNTRIDIVGKVVECKIKF